MLFVDCGVLLSECTVSKSCVVKIQVLGCSRLLASHVACSHAVKGGGGAWSVLQGCAVTGNAIFGVHVRDAISRVELVVCTLDARAINRCGARCIVH